jgi:hypothetical protein
MKKTMKKLHIFGLGLSLALCLALSLGLSTAGHSRGGGMGLHHSGARGGASGTSPAAPGTSSAGTALSSSGAGGPAIKGPALGTGNPVVDRQDKEVSKIVQSMRGVAVDSARSASQSGLSETRS